MDSQKLKTYFDLLLPSLPGLIIYAVLALSTTFAQIQFASVSDLSIPQVGRSSLPIIGNWIVSVVGISRANTVVVYGFWVAIGIMVWLLLKSALADVNELSDDISFRHYIWPNAKERNQPLTHFFEKILFRLAAFVLLLFYIRRVMIQLVYAFVGSGHRAVWLRGHTLLGAPIMIIIWVFAWHGLVLLVRLLLLKNRIFDTI